MRKAPRQPLLLLGAGEVFRICDYLPPQIIAQVAPTSKAYSKASSLQFGKNYIWSLESTETITPNHYNEAYTYHDGEGGVRLHTDRWSEGYTGYGVREQSKMATKTELLGSYNTLALAQASAHTMITATAKDMSEFMLDVSTTHLKTAARFFKTNVIISQRYLPA